MWISLITLQLYEMMSYDQVSSLFAAVQISRFKIALHMFGNADIRIVAIIIWWRWKLYLAKTNYRQTDRSSNWFRESAFNHVWNLVSVQKHVMQTVGSCFITGTTTFTFSFRFEVQSRLKILTAYSIVFTQINYYIWLSLLSIQTIHRKHFKMLL